MSRKSFRLIGLVLVGLFLVPGLAAAAFAPSISAGVAAACGLAVSVGLLFE